jgi:hypothetical protein
LELPILYPNERLIVIDFPFYIPFVTAHDFKARAANGTGDVVFMQEPINGSFGSTGHGDKHALPS